MNLLKPTRVEWITFVSLMPIIAILLDYLLFGEHFANTRVILEALPIIIAIFFSLWYLHIITMHVLREKLPEFRHNVLRIFLMAIIHLVLITGVMVSLFYGFELVRFTDYHFSAHNFKLGVLLGVSVTLISTTVWEGEYIFNKWKETLAEKELLEQLNLTNEFESLKSQVNPHFLFNCFNTLSSLISENKEEAEKFLDELSKVYRYLLRSNEDGLTTLKGELQFIRSYFELLRSRYGNAVEMQIEIDKKYETYLLPSLSLQLLLENAVKHNVVSRQYPLVIDIFTTTGNKLVVNNNLQPKLIKAPSNNIGLENIKLKYDILKQDGFQVLQDDKNFTVVLPLLWNKTTDNNYFLTNKSLAHYN